MAYWGKLIGAAAGLFMAGPVGALFGVVAGHSVDRARTASRPGARVPREVLVDVGFALMGHVAKADGRVSEAEIAAADAWMRRLRLDAGQRRRAVDRFNAGKQPGFSVADTVRRVRGQGRADPRAMRLLLEMLLAVAMADGHLAPASRQALAGVLSQLGLPAALLEAVLGQAGLGTGGQRRRPSAPSLQQDCALLGVPVDAEPAAIKSAYRRLMSRHHPDKAAGNADATARAQAINAAYRRIREARGF
ncbi:MAG: co-chaperone DjlA [Immundisolibacter sp.]